MASLSLARQLTPGSLTFGVLTGVLILMIGLVYAWRLHQVRTVERRSAGRRRGQPVVVEVVHVTEARTPLQRAKVIDRSLNGLGILSSQHVATGTQLDVRPQGVGDSVPWARLEVISSVRDGQSWRLGCAFVVPPAWATLRTFG